MGHVKPHERLPGARVSSWMARAAWTIGVVLLAFWSAVTATGALGARQELQRFEARQPTPVEAASFDRLAAPDQHLWSAVRVRAWLAALAEPGPMALAVLRIPRIGLEAPVLEGTDELTLDRAVGHIENTASPDGKGNIGIAGHRDGFFRPLKDIQPGDVLEIETRGSVDRYRVERTWIVDPEDVSVLAPTEAPTVTLVTCYPFYFIGSAPQRFIVRAVRTESIPLPKKRIGTNH